MSEIGPKLSDNGSTNSLETKHLDSKHIGNDPSNLVHITDSATRLQELFDIEKEKKQNENIQPESCQISTQCIQNGNENRKAFPPAKIAFFEENNDSVEDEDTKRDIPFDSKFALRENQIGKPISKENVASCQEISTDSRDDEIQNDNATREDNKNPNVSKKSIDKTTSDVEYQNDESKITSQDDTQTTPDDETPTTEKDKTRTAQEENECEQFTRNFRSALQQAEARGQQVPTINTQTFQPLRRATKRISNRIQFLQNHLQEEVTSGFANRKSIDRLKKQLAEAEELSANFQSIRKHQRSVSRSSRSTTRTRHSTTPGKRERPYRHWLGMAKVVTPGPDNRFIISSREDRQSKATTGPMEAPRPCKSDKKKAVATKEIAVNTIVEETEPNCSIAGQTGNIDTQALIQPKHEDDENSDIESLLESISTNNKKIPISSPEKKQQNKQWSLSSNPNYSPGGDKTDPNGALVDIANAIQRLDLKQVSSPTVCDNPFKSVGLDSFVFNKEKSIEEAKDISYKPSEKINPDETFLVDFEGFKEVKNKMSYGDSPNLLKSSTMKCQYLPPHTNNTAPFTTKTQFKGNGFNSPGMIYEQFSFPQSTHPGPMNSQEIPPSSTQFSSAFCDGASQSNPFLHFTPRMQDKKDVSPDITRKRFTSPYYIPKRPTADSKAYHPRPLGYSNTLPCKAALESHRLRRHKERSSSRLAARSGSRSVARRQRGAGGKGEELSLPQSASVFSGDIDKEIEAIRNQVASEQPLLKSPCQLPESDMYESLQAASRARLQHRINMVRRTQKGTKYIPVRAIQDHRGKLPGQLGFKAGQAIKLRCPEVEPPDGLCYGYYRKGRLRTKKKGLFPLSCVELQSDSLQTAL